jgi:hypothetical protein
MTIRCSILDTGNKNLSSKNLRLLWGLYSHLVSGYRLSFSGVKRPERKAIHSPPVSAEVKSRLSYISAPPIQLRDAGRDIFALTLTVDICNGDAMRFL